MAALEGLRGAGPEWQRLAQGGVAELICQQALELGSYTATFPNLPREMSKQDFDAVNEMSHLLLRHDVDC